MHVEFGFHGRVQFSPISCDLLQVLKLLKFEAIGCYHTGMLLKIVQDIFRGDLDHHEVRLRHIQSFIQVFHL